MSRRTPSLDASRGLARADLTAFAERLGRASDRLDGGVVGEEVAQDHRVARSLLGEATERLRDAATADELVAAIGLLAGGRRRLATVEAYLVAETPPTGRFACFFDPAHGPSVSETDWTTVRYGTRAVPVCLQDAALLGAGVRPEGRTVRLDGRTVPYWEARDATAVYLLGYFGGHRLLEWLGNRSTRLGRTVVRPPSGGIKDGLA